MGINVGMNYSLRTRLIFVLSAFLLLFTGVIVFLYNMMEGEISKLSERGLLEKIQQIESTVNVTWADNINRVTDIAQRSFEGLSNRWKVDETSIKNVLATNQVTSEKTELSIPQMLIDGKPVENNEYVDQLGNSSGQAVTLFLNHENGLLRVSTNVLDLKGQRAIGTFIPRESPVYKSIADGKAYYGRAFVVKEWYITAYLPLKDQKGKVYGALFVGTVDNSSKEIMSYLKKQKLYQTGYYYIINSKAEFLLHPAAEGKNMWSEKDLEGRTIFQDIIKQKNGKIEYKWLNAETKLPQDKIAIFRHFENLDWIVAASLNTDEVVAEARTYREITAGVVGALIVGSLLFSFFFGNQLSLSLLTIAKQLEKQGSEILQLAHESSANSRDLTQMSATQAAALTETASASEEINSMIQKNADISKQSMTVSEKSASSVRDGMELMEGVMTSIDALAQALRVVQEQADFANKNTLSTVQMFTEVQSKTTVINDIVFQTKLLSFNASVEAARAAEHGKGFAVVAEEIGNLARMSGAAAVEIASLLDKSTLEVRENAEVTRKGLEKILSESHERLEKTRTAAESCKIMFQNINENTNDVTTMVSEIATASKEQANGVNEISNAIHSLNAENQKLVVLSDKGQSDAEILDQSAIELNAAVENLKVMVEGKHQNSATLNNGLNTTSSLGEERDHQPHDQRINKKAS